MSMDANTLNTKLTTKFAKRADMDFLRRSLPGVLLYALLWPSLAWATDFYRQAPTLSLQVSAVFISISVLRLLHAYSTYLFYDKHTKLWRSLLYILAYSHATTLSATFVLMVINEPFHDMVMITLLIIISTIIGASSSLSPKLRVTQIYISFALIPGMISCYYSEEFQHLTLIFIVAWVYLILVCHRYHAEYRRAFHIEMKLKENQKTLETLNKTDTLTGIYNRQFFDDALDMQWDLASRSQTSLSILFLDLDLFKRINDEYGHLIGDKALCHVAYILKEKAKRKSDMIARYGGEEFAIILPSTSREDAIALAHSIREFIFNTPLVCGERKISLSISIGVNSTIPTIQKSRIDFLDEADQALFQAKAQGRNKVVCYLEAVCEVSPKEHIQQDAQPS